MNPLHLLDQADRLATGGTGRPRQADLRRAVSAAYYALFHQLTQDAARQVTADRRLRPLVARQLDHGAMRGVARLFADGTPPGPLRDLLGAVPDELVEAATAFVLLQQARHTADYDSRAAANLDRGEARAAAAQARRGRQAWLAVRDTPAGELFLLALLPPRLGTRG